MCQTKLLTNKQIEVSLRIKCCICDEVGARNFETLDALLITLEENCEVHINVVTQVVTMIDLPNYKYDKQQIHQLPWDCPILMIEVEPGLSDLPSS